jgi:hypothetical protein
MACLLKVSRVSFRSARCYEHGKVPSHFDRQRGDAATWTRLTEFTNGPQASKGGTDSETGETRLGNGGLQLSEHAEWNPDSTHVDNTFLSELVKQTLGDLGRESVPY